MSKPRQQIIPCVHIRRRRCMHVWALPMLFLLAALASCGGRPNGASTADATSGRHKPASRGLPFEMVVIAPQQAFEGEVSDSIDMLLRCSTPVLPQHEPMFRLDVV